jgi:hypothetical protein
MTVRKSLSAAPSPAVIYSIAVKDADGTWVRCSKATIPTTNILKVFDQLRQILKQNPGVYCLSLSGDKIGAQLGLDLKPITILGRHGRGNDTPIDSKVFERLTKIR